MATPGESLSRLAEFMSQQTARMEGRRERASERTEQRRRFEARMEAERLRAAEVEARFQAQAQESARRHGLGQEALAFETRQAGMKEATPATAAAYVARLRQMGDPEAMAPGTERETLPSVEQLQIMRTLGEPAEAVGPLAAAPPGAKAGPPGEIGYGQAMAPTQPIFAALHASYQGRAKEAAQSREDVAATGFYKMLAKVDPAEAALVAGQHLGQEGETTAAPDVPEHVRRAQEAADARAERERESKERQAGLRGRRGAGRARPIPDTRLRRYFREGNVAAISAAYMSGAIPEMAGRGAEGLAEYLQMGFEGAQAERSALAAKWAGDRRVQGLSREIAQAEKESRNPLIQYIPDKKAAADRMVRGLRTGLDKLLEALESKAARGGYEPPEITDYPPPPAGGGYDEPEEPIPPPQTMGPGGAQRSAPPIPARVRRMLADMTPQEQAATMAKLKAQGFEVPAGF